MFGCTSIWINTFTPTITSFVFSPFYSAGAYHGNIYSLVIALIPRMLIGVVAAVVYRFLVKNKISKVLACAAAGLFGSLTNTILVLSGIYIFFGPGYAAAKGMPFNQLFTFIVGIIGVNGGS